MENKILPIDGLPICAVSEINKKHAELFINGYVVPSGWFADGQTYHSVNTFAKEFRAIDGKYDEITVHMGAFYGGSTYEGEAIAYMIENAKSVVHTHVSGLSASMGFRWFLAGKERSMGETAQVMAHKCWTVVVGNADELRKNAADMDKIDDNLKKVTKARSTMSDEEVDQIFTTDTFMTADEAFKYGLATKIIPLKGAQDKSQTQAAMNMKGFLGNPFFGGLFPNFNQKPQMTQAEIDKQIADAKAEAKAEAEAAHKVALDAKDAEIATLQNASKKDEEPPKDAPTDAPKDVNADLNAKIDALTSALGKVEAKLASLEKSTDPEPDITKKDAVTSGATQEKSFTSSWVENL